MSHPRSARIASSFRRHPAPSATCAPISRIDRRPARMQARLVRPDRPQSRSRRGNRPSHQGEWTVYNDIARGETMGRGLHVLSRTRRCLYGSGSRTSARGCGLPPDTAFEEALQRVGQTLAKSTEPDTLCRHLLGEIIVRLDALGMTCVPQPASVCTTAFAP